MSTSSSHKILLVDDEPLILKSLQRQLGSTFDLTTCVDPVQALELIKTKQFALVVSDMRMPGIDGAQLLQATKQHHPDSIRVMLTGNSDLDTAVRAINDGSIFRFLTKPCTSTDISAVIHEGLEQYELVTAKKELLQKTLTSSVKILTDLLALADPDSFNRLLEFRNFAKDIAAIVSFKNIWELELTIMLASLGRLLIPKTTLQKIDERIKISTDEKSVLIEAGKNTSALISQIPRLEGIAQNIEALGVNLLTLEPLEKNAVRRKDSELVTLINLIIDINAVRLRGEKVSSYIGSNQSSLPPAYIQPLAKHFAKIETRSPHLSTEIFEVRVKDLCPGQKILSDVLTKNGTLLISKGHTLTEATLPRIVNYASLVGVTEPILVDCLLPTIAGDELQ